MTETYVGFGSTANLFGVLLADGSRERANSFLIKGTGYHLTVVNSSEKLREALAQPWDLLIHHCFLGDWKEPVDTTVPDIIEAFQKGRLRGVICAATIETDAKKFCKPLLEAGVPFKFIPFSYHAPSEHKVVPLKLEAIQLPASMD